MCDNYLLTYHKEAIIELLKHSNANKHFSININFVELFENDPNLANQIVNTPEKSLEEWNSGLGKAQNHIILQTNQKLIYNNQIHCRFFGLPICSELHRTILPTNHDTERLLQVSGSVIRITAIKILEFQRQYVCTKCKNTQTVKAEYERKNIIVPPKKCTNIEQCNSTNIIPIGKMEPEFCKDYQEIKIQETLTKMETKRMPQAMWVTLEDDLVDSCQPGDSIIICGIIKRRWGLLSPGKKIEVELVLRANHIQVNNSSSGAVKPEMEDMFNGFLETYSNEPLSARDIIIKSICPQIFGMYIVKLAIAVTLASGSHTNSNQTGVKVRSEPHLLLVGDPGTGKSQLLRFASQIVPRSVLTTGVGSTAAGLTVAAIMENGEWQLEGGALVLADGGICCIDEFSSMKEHDRTSIHEPMEQQTISVAKAGIVCKLSTRCSILAATNPKGNIDPSQPLHLNVALASPLLSRFDLIFLLQDKVNIEWDSLVADYILNQSGNLKTVTNSLTWTVETLQAYFCFIKKVQPVLTEETNSILGAYYQAQRRKDYRNKARTTVRLLDSLVRLSQGHARLMYHKKVEVMDALVAVMLVETAMNDNAPLFNFTVNIQSDFPENPTQNYRELADMVLNQLELPELLENELARLANPNQNRDISSEIDHTALSSTSQVADISTTIVKVTATKADKKELTSQEDITNNAGLDSVTFEQNIFEDNNITITPSIHVETPKEDNSKMNLESKNIESILSVTNKLSRFKFVPKVEEPIQNIEKEPDPKRFKITETTDSIFEDQDDLDLSI